MRLETDRIIITEFNMSMDKSIHENSLDEDTRKFLPDEVFETIDEARDTIEFLMNVYVTGEGPLVYPILLKDMTTIGYVELVPIKEGYEVGYQIGQNYRCNGYATEALTAFLTYIMDLKCIDYVYGICIFENEASKKVLEKCGFQKVFEGMGNYQGKQRMIIRYVYKNN